METWIKWLLGIIGGGSLFLGIVVTILFLVGEPQQAMEVREIPDEIDRSVDNVTDEVASTGKTVLSQLNEDRKEAVAQENDPSTRGLINMIYLYTMGFVIYVFVIIILALTGLKDKINF
jgi:hypothetical protein